MNHNFEKKVYISHPSSGLKENTEKVSNVLISLVKNFPNILFLSPVNAFDPIYGVTTYERGMDYCYALLDMCDEMWVFGDWKNSKGCNLEIKYCEKHNIPYMKLNMINVSEG